MKRRTQSGAGGNAGLSGRTLAAGTVALSLALTAAWLARRENITRPPPPGAASAPVMAAVRETATSPPAVTATDSLSYSNYPDLEATRNLIEAAEPGERDLLLRDALALLLEESPDAAARFATALEEPHLRELALRQLSQDWGRRDPGAALAWAQSLPDAAERRAALADLCLGLGTRDPGAALRIWDEHEWAGVESNARDGLLQQWARNDFSAALDWYQGHVEAHSTDLVDRLLFERAQDHPEDAARLAQELIPEDTRRAGTLVMITQQWARRDPAAAGAWVAQWPPGALRQRLAVELPGADPGF